MRTNVNLTPEMERFARKCVKSGRYNSMGEVIRSGLRLLQEQEEHRRQFGAMLRQTEEEADQDGTFALESVLTEAEEIINKPSLR